MGQKTCIVFKTICINGHVADNAEVLLKWNALKHNKWLKVNRNKKKTQRRNEITANDTPTQRGEQDVNVVTWTNPR